MNGQIPCARLVNWNSSLHADARAVERERPAEAHSEIRVHRSRMQAYGLLLYQDHTGPNTMKVWNARISNKRPGVAAVRLRRDIVSSGSALSNRRASRTA